jgi:hypothetical protein
VTGASLFAKERIGFNLNLASSLLNWLNSVYRPAVPGETAERQSAPRFSHLLGRRQVVRQWILIPPCGGSNPPAPARQSLS